MSSYQYRKSHCRDKTILRPSYLYNGVSYTDKMTSLYWIRAQLTHCGLRWSYESTALDIAICNQRYVVQYSPRIVHIVCVLLYFIVVRNRHILPKSFGVTFLVPVKQAWKIWVNGWHEFTNSKNRWYNHNKPTKGKAKPCAYLLMRYAIHLWGQDKMATITQTMYVFKRIFWNEYYFIFIWISLKYVPRGPIMNMPPSAQMVAWRRAGDKPLSEPNGWTVEVW